MSIYKESNLHIHEVFPTIVGVYENFLDEMTNISIVKQCHEISSSEDIEQGEWLPGKFFTDRVYHSANMAKSEMFQPILIRTDRLMDHVCRLYIDDIRYKCSRSWFSVYSNGVFQEPISHMASTFNIIYFADVPDGSSEIVFLNPLMSELGFIFTDANSFSLKPETNMAIIIRSNVRYLLMHEKNEKSMTIITANYNIDPQKYAEAFE